MPRLFKLVSLMLLVFLAAGALFAQASQPKPAWPAYAFSVLLGFGTGHYYLGENGTGFLIGDVAGLGVMIAGGIVELVSVFSIDYYSPSSFSSSLTGTEVGLGIVVVGSLVYLVSHVWEVIDVFGAVDRATKAGKVAEIVPVVDIRRTSFELGVSLKY